MPIIARVVNPRSTIVSDEWAAYRGIGNYTHLTVNHSQNFINPTTGAHTNNEEAYWMHAKAIFKCMNGMTKDMVPGYLDEFMWHEHYAATYHLAYLNILRHIAEKYPC